MKLSREHTASRPGGADLKSRTRRLWPAVLQSAGVHEFVDCEIRKCCSEPSTWSRVHEFGCLPDPYVSRVGANQSCTSGRRFQRDEPRALRQSGNDLVKYETESGWIGQLSEWVRYDHEYSPTRSHA